MVSRDQTSANPLIEDGISYPRCLSGARACPPEDSGGSLSYAIMLKTINNTAAENYDEVIEWLGNDFDPERFDPAKVKFTL